MRVAKSVGIAVLVIGCLGGTDLARGQAGPKVAQDRQTLVLAAHRSVVSTAPEFQQGQTSNGRLPGWEEKVRRFWSDTVITQTVKRDLAREDVATLLRISVSTHQGVVHLSGAVETEAEIQRAEQIARRTKGVVRVVNFLRTQPAGIPEDPSAARKQ